MDNVPAPQARRYPAIAVLVGNFLRLALLVSGEYKL